MSGPYRIVLEELGVASLAERPPQALLDEILEHWLSSTATKAAGAAARMYEVESSSLQPEVKAAVGLVCSAASISAAGNGQSTLATVPTLLRVGGSFVEQPAVPNAQSAVLVGDDLLLTSLHDLDPDQVAGNFRVVFDFKVVGGQTDTTIDDRRIFDVVEAVSYGNHYGKEFYDDWLLLRLHRATGRTSTLTLAGGLPTLVPPPPVPAGLWMIGHPYGLPMKLSGSGNVTEVHSVHFECNLGAVAGHSGSAVVDDTARSIVGILQDGHWIDGEPTSDVTSASTFKKSVEWAAKFPTAYPFLHRLIRWAGGKPRRPTPAMRRRAARRLSAGTKSVLAPTSPK